MQYGDEGKGQIVDTLSAQSDVIVRYNGGANAGHSVSIGNEKYVLHQIPIGTLTPNKQNVLANGVVISADPLLGEMESLTQAGVDLSNLKISDRAHVVMPYHLIEEDLRYKLAAEMLGEDQTLGTTRKGIGPCYADKASRDTAIRISDLFETRSLRPRLEFITCYKNATLGGLATHLNEPFKAFDCNELVSMCATWAEQLSPYVCDTFALLSEEIDQGRKILFEGANAALLDIDHGTYPYVTSSNGSTLGITSGTGLSPAMVGRKIGVAKAYMSRVGMGPFVTELDGPLAEELRKAGSEYGSTTGRPRRVGWLDLPALSDMVTHNHIDELVITGLAVLSTLDEFRVCTGYLSEGGQQVRHLPASIEVMKKLKPVYREIKVTGHVQDCRSARELPDWAVELIQLIEHSVTRVAAVCIGKRRDQILWY